MAHYDEGFPVEMKFILLCIIMNDYAHYEYLHIKMHKVFIINIMNLAIMNFSACYE